MVARLEEKKKAEKASTEPDNSSAIATTDVGHDMAPVDIEVLPDPDDKSAAAYAAVNDTGDSA